MANSKYAQSIIPDEHLMKVCKGVGGSSTCAFILMSAHFTCTKGTELEALLRSRVTEGTIRARGDNCSGPPDFVPTSEVK